MTADQIDHIGRVLAQHNTLTAGKYRDGQIEHGGNCWEKPGMLAHALDESSDLSVYLFTLREQLLALADDCTQRGEDVTAARIRFVVRK